MRDIVQEHVGSSKLGQEVVANDEMMRFTFQVVDRLLHSTTIAKYAAGVQNRRCVAISRIERAMLPCLDCFDDIPTPYFRKFKESANHLAGVL